MTKAEAYKILAEVTGSLKLTKKDHITVEQAINVLAMPEQPVAAPAAPVAVKPEEAPKSESQTA